MTDTPHWLVEPALQHLFAHTRAMGGEARVVGGAVRDFLMNREGGDVDVASTLPPQSTIALAEAAGWKAVPTGLAHGTVTLVLPNRVVEVTTLRRDVETDGRHAIIEYSTDFAEDAARRDFTMNALYMDAEGTITDTVGGRADIETQTLRFIGDAATRIAEDGLRILRFFRFLATHGKAPADADALAACEAQRALLANLSGERIAQEMRKLLAAPDPTEALGLMARIGLPEYLTAAPWDVEGARRVLKLEATHQQSPKAGARLLSMVAPNSRTETAHWISERWKLSRDERLAFSVMAQPGPVNAAQVKAWLVEKQLRERIVGRLVLLAADEAIDVTALLNLAQHWQPPVFPVTSQDMIARGHCEGKALGKALRALEKRWAESDYTLTKDALLA